jgi:hypothetical protein
MHVTEINLDYWYLWSLEGRPAAERSRRGWQSLQLEDKALIIS